MKYVDIDNYERFDKRYTVCPVCCRDNVLLRYYSGGVALEEHPVPTPIVAHPAPVDPGARFNPRAAEATYARLRCPASLAPLIVAEDL